MSYYSPPSSTPPPPPPLGAFEQEDVPTPPVAWAIPVAAVLAVIGAILPWFHGHASAPGGATQSFKDSLYSYEDGRIGLLPPVALVVISIGVIGLLRGKSPRRFSRGSSGPVVSAARGVIIVGVVSLVCVAIAWFLVPSQYKFDDGNGNKVSWNTALDRLHANGVDASFSRGPQAGYFLTIAAAVVAIIAGVLMLMLRRRTVDAPAIGSYPPPVNGFPPPGPAGYGPPPAPGYAPGYGPAAGGYAPPPGPGYAPPPSYGPPPGGYAPPPAPGYAPPPSYGPPPSFGPPSYNAPPTPGPDLTK